MEGLNTRRRNNRYPVAAAFLMAVVSLTLASCRNSQAVEEAKLDFAAEALPFPRPVHEPLASLSGVPALPPSVQSTLDLQRAFFSGDFVRLDAALLKARNEFLRKPDGKSGADRLVESIHKTQLAGIDACSDWLKAMPNSYPAHWVCGAMWQNGAWAARGTAYANKVSEARFALMHERQEQSNALLERALTRP